MSRVPFELLELTILSAQNLAPASQNLPKNLCKNLSKHHKTYAVAWIDPTRKLKTRPDTKGNNNPHWNQKFVYRVEDKHMDSDTASVVMEIYAVGWFKDNLVGSVTVLIRDLIPADVRHERRVVALQVRRPHSGRPQGILSVGVALLDNTMKSMPLCPAFVVSGDKKLTRTLSDQTDLSRMPGEKKRKTVGLICPFAGDIAADIACDGTGNGADESVISDLGPSPSVVAIAVAHGLYPLQQRTAAANTGSLVLEDWTVRREEAKVEDLQTKLEQWRLDQGYQRLGNTGDNKRQGKSIHRRSRTAEGSEGDGMFSCFGNACGCEFAVSYGGGGKNRHRDSTSGIVIS
ncbi:hypothetical protein SASPL_127433 [Salvia splendens]|uniref:C2 domain-containing protein n=1 Tax=Salvia splendens TaxID=180675 RepID=A0A8X8ZMK7_SALSN|nr:uncharacterized protein LOC121751743 [Salvia splendens]KAG6409394.1 hypothetical protein SASPL_127433 [Salvia splendens]